MSNDKHVSVEEMQALVNNVDASNVESVNKFLAGADSMFQGVDPAERAKKVSMLTQELADKGVLPQFLVTAGMSDWHSDRYQQSKENNGWNLTKSDLENMASNGKKGFYNVDGAAQFLASAVLRNFDDIRNGSWTTDKIDYSQIKKWADRENSELAQRRGLENALVQLGSGEKLKEVFGSEHPKLDDIKARLTKDDTIRELIGNDEKSPFKSKLLTPEQRSAAEFLRDNFDTVRCIDNYTSRYGDDFVSPEKMEYWAKNKLHTSGELAQQHKQEHEQLVQDEQAEIKAAKERAAAAAQQENSQQARIKQLEEQLKQLQETLKAQREGTPPKPKADTPVPPKADTPVPPKADTPAPPKPDTPAPPKPDTPAPPKPDAPVPAKPQPERPPVDAAGEEKANKELQELLKKLDGNKQAAIAQPQVWAAV